ncbi:YqhV family protein [Bacillus sp. Marseille-P3661]|uniref:YqhV family protein n=1 Tax=Bacillus sp. Marseille-P3661 TaxID=1936234 RepID=UPI000C85A06B|nr:YqhV family protein [Bacillus sp. Marseille-P3661]
MKRWLSLLDTSVASMAGLRIISALIELSAAIAMLLFNDVRKALAINALLAVVGPVILITTMSIGLISLADEISFRKLLFIGAGVGLILFGIYK